ncbi:MAG: hypothetical protein U0269_05060 [Polyangiales bacterium]
MSERADPSLFSAALGAVLASATYLATTAGRVGIVWYLPLERRWVTVVPPGALGMEWFSRALWTLVALAVGAAVGHRVARTSNRDLGRASAALFQIAWLLLGWGAVFTVLWLVRGAR